MTLLPSVAIYFVLWCGLVFVVLPFGANSQHETGEVTQGTDASAPHELYVFRRVVATTLEPLQSSLPEFISTSACMGRRSKISALKIVG